MSTFGGLMQEYRHISIDRFDGQNLQSTVYLLSHNHSDHTVGLSSHHFQYRLLSSGKIKLYCSYITRELLLIDARYEAIWKSIVAVDINAPLLIDIPDADSSEVKDQVTVTLLQAGHCPGSVMFLFEGCEGTALYTGDFRLTKQDFMSFEHLKSGSRIKNIKSLYIDTTFCIPQAMFIPSRDECTDAAIEVIRDWLSRGSSHVVLLQYRADIGYENLFIRFSIEFKMKIHVDLEKYKQYEKLGDMTEYVTTDINSTRIHACRKMNGECGSDHRNSVRLPCGDRQANKNCRIRRLLFSTMCFVHRVALDDYTIHVNDTFCRVCYSFHSSYSEIRDAVLYLRPQRAYPNVIASYQEGENEQKMQERLDEFVQLAQRCEVSLGSSSFCGLGKLRKSKRKQHSIPSSNEMALMTLGFGDCTQPTVEKRRLTDSIDILADLKTVQSKGVADKCTDRDSFRLLFGSGPSSQSSKDIEPDSLSVAEIDVVSPLHDGQTTSAEESSYDPTNSEEYPDLCGSHEGMTQDDREMLTAYTAEQRPVLSYLSDEEQPEIVALDPAMKAVDVPVTCLGGNSMNDQLSERKEAGNKTTMDHPLDLSTCKPLSAVKQVLLGKRGRIDEAGGTGDCSRSSDDSNIPNKKRTVRVDSDVEFVSKPVCRDALSPSARFQLRERRTNEKNDVIVIGDDDDDVESRIVSVFIKRSQESRNYADGGLQQTDDSDATTIDMCGSPDKKCHAMHLPVRRESTLIRDDAASGFNSDATTADENSSAVGSELRTSLCNCDVLDVEESNKYQGPIIIPITTLIKDVVMDLTSPVEISDDAEPEKTPADDCVSVVSRLENRTRSEDDIFMYSDSPPACVESVLGSASLSRVCFTRSKGYSQSSWRLAARQSTRSIVRNRPRAVKRFKVEQFKSDTDVFYDADSETESNDNDVELPVFRFEKITLRKRQVQQTSSDSDTSFGAVYDKVQKIAFGRLSRPSPCSSSCWSSWSNDEVANRALVERRNSSLRLRGSNSDTGDCVVLISDDTDDQFSDVRETARRAEVFAGCARMLTIDDIASTTMVP